MLPLKIRARLTAAVVLLAMWPSLALAAPKIEVGKPFPDIALPSLEDGRMMSIADFRGQRVVLHVFASW